MILAFSKKAFVRSSFHAHACYLTLLPLTVRITRYTDLTTQQEISTWDLKEETDPHSDSLPVSALALG